jgi:hypothetical protein
MKKPTQRLIAEVARRHAKVEMTIGIDLGDVWSHYCTLNQEGAVVDRGRFRTTPKAIEKWFTDLPPARIAMEAGTHSIWISEQLQELGHEVNHILRPRGKDSSLRQWGLHLADRGGKQAKNRAVVAVARELAILLHHIWTTQEPDMPFYAEAA